MHARRTLLVIAGAGSGDTNTLAHRVTHVIVNGAEPRRILLMTFSRRAAGEMTGRVEQICAEALGANAGIMTGALSAKLMQHFECVTWPLATAVGGRRQDAREVRIDIGTKMRSMWR